MTVPPAGASTGISIFIDSMMISASPCATFWPTATSIFQMLPATSERTDAI